MTETNTLIIFGASGDLTHRKLMPALFNLHTKRRLPPGFNALGMARSSMSDEAFRQTMREGAQTFARTTFDAQAWDDFAPRLSYEPGDPTHPECLSALQRRLSDLEAPGDGAANRLYYLATPPHVYSDITLSLGHADMLREDAGWRRVVVEKPFGHDLASARALNDALHQVLAESQIYRIDHYLGKETVQNVLMLRFANSIFEPLWNRNYVDHVQITVAESVGVKHRARFYDRVGVLRDMFQNHIMQLLSLVAMEPPASFDADSLRNERVKVLRSVRPIPVDEIQAHAVFGQYQGYLEEEGVASGSRTPTFAALRFFIDNWRWQGVPFYMRSGKALATKTTEVVIRFKSVPHLMFPLPPDKQIRPNALSLCLQPDEGIHLRFEAKVPDTVAETRSVDMEFHYADSFGANALPEAYERLLLDALNGDPSLFTRADTIELAWGLIDPILQSLEDPGNPPPVSYAQGSWGPAEAQDFIAQDGRAWDLGCGGHT